MRLIKNLSLLLVFAALSGIASAQTLFNQVPFYQGTPAGAVAPATPAATSIKSSSGFLLGIVCFNNNATPVYVKIFNLGTGSITLGTTSATWSLECPGNT